MAIKEVNRDEIGKIKRENCYGTKIIKEFVNSGFDTALVDIPEGKTNWQVYYTLKGTIKRHSEFSDVMYVIRRGDKVYLLKK